MNVNIFITFMYVLIAFIVVLIFLGIVLIVFLKVILSALSRFPEEIPNDEILSPTEDTDTASTAEQESELELQSVVVDKESYE